MGERAGTALLIVAAILAATPALAQTIDTTAYVRARAAAGRGDAVNAAKGYAVALTAMPNDPAIALGAYRQGLAVGDFALAARGEASLARSNASPVDAPLLRFALALKSGDRAGQDAALDAMGKGPLNFIAPVLRAWVANDRGQDPFPILDSAAAQGMLARRYADECRALLLIARGQTAAGLDALKPLLNLRRASEDLRIDAAILLGMIGQRDAAAALLSSDAPEMEALRRRLTQGGKPGAALGTAWLFLSLAVDLSQEDAPPEISVVLTRAAILLNPGDDRARLYLAESLSKLGMHDVALGVLAEVKPGSPFTPGATTGRIAALNRAGRGKEAIALARGRTEGPGALRSDFEIYGDLLVEDKQFGMAADAYGRAIALGGEGDAALHLQRGMALDKAGRWDAAQVELRRATELAPGEAAGFSYLGTALVKRGEKLEEAQALLERANQLKPGDPAITDALAWAYFTRGDVKRALPLLEAAVKADPGGSLANEHLGDAYWRLGRRYEARYAWGAAAVYADADSAERLANKVANGL